MPCGAGAARGDVTISGDPSGAGGFLIQTPAQYEINKSYTLYPIEILARKAPESNVWTVDGQCSASAGNLVRISGLDGLDREIGV